MFNLFNSFNLFNLFQVQSSFTLFLSQVLPAVTVFCGMGPAGTGAAGHLRDPRTETKLNEKRKAYVKTASFLLNSLKSFKSLKIFLVKQLKS